MTKYLEGMPRAPAVSVLSIADRILVIRGRRVMIDADLAELYGVTTKHLNQQVKRNARRFPGDFMFQLVATEKSQLVTNCDHLSRLRFAPQPPFAFTEHGAIMLASVLNSQRAADISVLIVRAYVHLRDMLANNKEIAAKLTEIEKRLVVHDRAILKLFHSIRALMTPPEPESRPIGFTANL